MVMCRHLASVILRCYNSLPCHEPSSVNPLLLSGLVSQRQLPFSFSVVQVPLVLMHFSRCCQTDYSLFEHGHQKRFQPCLYEFFSFLLPSSAAVLAFLTRDRVGHYFFQDLKSHNYQHIRSRSLSHN